jgi:hypothetical protein
MTFLEFKETQKPPRKKFQKKRKPSGSPRK